MAVAPREKRKRRRTRTRHAGWIKGGDKGRLIPCVLWDRSDKGARIAAAYSSKLPQVFTLVEDQHTSRFCRIVWRKGPLMGVRFIESDEEAAELAAADSRKARQAELAGPVTGNVALMAAARYQDALHDPVPPASHRVSRMAGGLLLLLIALTIMFFFAGRENGPGVVWAAEVCRQANNMCRHPEFTGGASVLMALVFLAARGMEG